MPLANFNCISPHPCTCCISPPALLNLLDVVLPCFVEAVRSEHERQVVMGILETINNVIKSCKEEVFKNPLRLKEISYVIRDVLKKKVREWRRWASGVALFVKDEVAKNDLT